MSRAERMCVGCTTSLPPAAVYHAAQWDESDEGYEELLFVCEDCDGEQWYDIGEPVMLAPAIVVTDPDYVPRHFELL